MLTNCPKARALVFLKSVDIFVGRSKGLLLTKQAPI